MYKSVKFFVFELYKNIIKKTFKKEVNINFERPIISITFDDAPKSSAIEGNRLLRRFGFYGTYYIAYGFSSSDEYFMDDDDIRMVVAEGHEVGCHTYDHIPLRFSTFKKTKQEIEKNISALKSILPEYNVCNFSYPLGQVGLGSKRYLNSVYDSMRTVDAGVNASTTDLTYLKSVNIYSNNFDRIKFLHYLDDVVKKNGWLILYTHDISSEYGPWGTSSDFEWVLKQISNYPIDVMPVCDVIKKINLQND
jgi:peptidoglycan/xylan/chitin deacetylase (PgdA/CDA1 family)